MTDMTVQIGRFGIDPSVTNAATVSRSDGGLTVSGLFVASTAEALMVARAQLLGLSTSPDEPVVPVLITGIRPGYWQVASTKWDEQPGAYDDTILQASWSVDLVTVDARAAGVFETRMLMPSDTGASPPTQLPWSAVPMQTSGWRTVPATTATTATRTSASGNLTVYTGSGLANRRAQWRCRPEAIYDGAATLSMGRSGMSGDIPPPGAVSFNTAGTYSWVVPTGVTNVRVIAAGGRGGNSPDGYKGGAGALVTTPLTVTPGETLTVTVGGVGANGVAVGAGSGSRTRPGGAGGAGGGGAGGYGSSNKPATFAMSGAGGGGSSDVRQGGTGLANRVVVAGGGGGATHGSTGGSADGWNGASGSGSPGSAAGGGTATAGGTPGGVPAGGAGGLQTGGAGAYNPAGTYGYDWTGGGGGGGGLYGGAGGYSQPQDRPSGSGGAGSSTAPNLGLASITTASPVFDFTRSGPYVSIAPIPAAGTGVGIPPADITYWPVVGRQVDNDPWGWQIDNGVIRVRPCYSTSEIGFAVSTWTGARWSAETMFGMFKWVGSASTTAASIASSITVLRNSPETVTIRCTFDDGDRLSGHTVDVTVRRGAWHAEIGFASTSPIADWAVGPAPVTTPSGTGVVTGTGNGVYCVAATAGADGEKWIVAKYRCVTADVSTTGRVVAHFTNLTTTRFAIGYVLSGESDATLMQRFNAGGGESVRYVTP